MLREKSSMDGIADFYPLFRFMCVRSCILFSRIYVLDEYVVGIVPTLWKELYETDGFRYSEWDKTKEVLRDYAKRKGMKDSEILRYKQIH